MRRFCLLAAAVSLLWAALVLVTGGFAFTLGGMRISSRSLLNPLLFAIAGGAAAWAVSDRGRSGAVLANDLRIFGAPVLVSMIGVIIVAGGYVARRLPAKAAVLSMQHSGSIRYYSGRATVRTDLIPPSQLDSTLAALRDSGYRPYILLEPWEVAPFQQRYAGHSALAPLDWPPAALLRESGIRIYDPADRQALAGRPPLTEIVP
jgi:hypothetical protein